MGLAQAGEREGEAGVERRGPGEHVARDAEPAHLAPAADHVVGAPQVIAANFKTSEHRTSLELDQRALLSPDLKLTWVFQHTYKEEFFKDLYGELGTGNQNNDYLTQSYELLLKPDYLLGSHQKLKGLLRLKLEQFSSFCSINSKELRSGQAPAGLYLLALKTP